MAVDIFLGNMDEGTDDPRMARAQLLEMGTRLNAYTFIFGNGLADKAGEIAQANAAGKPVVIVGVIHVASPATLAVPLVDRLSRMFTDASAITIDNGEQVRPEWFGLTQGCLVRAIAALPSYGGVVALCNRRYPPNDYHYGFGGNPGRAITKRGVRIKGARMPSFASDLRRLDDGSIIEGAVYAFANGFELFDVGIDHGIDVVNAYYGDGAAPQAGIHEGLLMSYPNASVAAAGTSVRGATLHNVRSLVHSPTAPVHAMILSEAYSGVTATGVIEVAMGIHGCVIKGRDTKVESITAYCNGVNGVIVKTALGLSTAATAYFNQIGRITTWAGAPPIFTPHAVAGKVGAGLRIHPESGPVDMLQIDQMFDYGHAQAVSIDGPDPVSNVSIGSIVGEGNFWTLYSSASSVSRCNFGDIVGRNSDIVALLGWGSETTNRIKSVLGVNVDVVLDCAGGVSPQVGMVGGESVVTALMRLRGPARPRIALVEDRSTNPIPRLYATDLSGTVPALNTGWSEVGGAGASPFYIVHGGEGIILNGLIKAANSGTSLKCIQLPAWAWPLSIKRFFARGLTAALVPQLVEIAVGIDGQVTVNEHAGGVANCLGWLSLDAISYPLT